MLTIEQSYRMTLPAREILAKAGFTVQQSHATHQMFGIIHKDHNEARQRAELASLESVPGLVLVLAPATGLSGPTFWVKALRCTNEPAYPMERPYSAALLGEKIA
jgi:hypothetical protein